MYRAHVFNFVACTMTEQIHFDNHHDREGESGRESDGERERVSENDRKKERDKLERVRVNTCAIENCCNKCVNVGQMFSQ